MNTLAILTAMIGFLTVFVPMIRYFRTIPRGTVPERTGGLAATLVAGAALSISAIGLAIWGERSAGALAYVPALFGLFFALLVLFMLAQPKAPLGDLKVKVGDQILPFAAKTFEGTAFDTSAMASKRILFKFYRGGWCPYCSAELEAFDQMSPDLAQYGVEIFALSKDAPDQAAIHKSRDSLSFQLLSDPDLDVIRQYGVEHHKVLSMDATPTKKIGGIPLGFGQPKFQTMAIPTTLLIDENGIIRWIDQSEDYRVRSSTDRILKAVQTAFDQNSADATLSQAV
jgi:peroxiredoxin